MRIRALLFVSLALALAQTSFGDTSTANNGSISSCTNLPSSPTNVSGTLYTQFDCSLYNDVNSYTIDLTSLLEEGGANLSDNVVGAGYVVVINGDPSTVSSGDTDDAALYNESLWDTVLYFPSDPTQFAGYGSDSLTVYWPGTFPAASDVQTLDEDLYGSGTDSYFFVQSTGDVTVYSAYANEYDVITPEPGVMLLLGFQLALAGGVILKMRRGARPPNPTSGD
jgi:hypothetical protein